MSTPLPPGQRAALIAAISPQRLEPHHRLATAEGLDVIELYLWDRDLAAAAIADIAVLEVALRNAMNAALVTRAGREDWYATDIGLDDRSLRAITKAWTQPPATRRAPGRVVSQLMFGFWRALLDSGATVGQGPLQRTVSYEDLWRADLHRAFRRTNPRPRQRRPLLSARLTNVGRRCGLARHCGPACRAMPVTSDRRPVSIRLQSRTSSPRPCRLKARCRQRL